MPLQVPTIAIIDRLRAKVRFGIDCQVGEGLSAFDGDIIWQRIRLASWEFYFDPGMPGNRNEQNSLAHMDIMNNIANNPTPTKCPK
jgi:hypothetical protein